MTRLTISAEAKRELTLKIHQIQMAEISVSMAKLRDFFRCDVEEILKNVSPVRIAPPPPCILAIANVRFLGRPYVVFGFE